MKQTVLGLRKYARDRCIKGYTKYPKKAELMKYIAIKNKSPLPLVNKNSISRMKAVQLREYGRDRCIRGYSKYTKQNSLRAFLINKAVKG